MISLKCLIFSSAGFRAVVDVFRILKEHSFDIMVPAFSTVRQWLLKYGLYKLQRSKRSPGGWFFIIDNSIQMGPQKFVVILGVKKLDINQNFCPTFADAEALIVQPLYNCPGEVIDELLEKATELIGEEPLAIISDESAENRKGCRLFLSRHVDTISLYDASHKINNCLKKEFEDDLRWQAFKIAASSSIQHLKLSSVAHLSPPRQHSKARMHSAFPLIDWGLNLLAFLDSKKSKELKDEEREKLNWIYEYRSELLIYSNFKQMCIEALNITHEKGYYKGVSSEYIKLTNFSCHTNIRCINFRSKIAELLLAEEKKISTQDHYLSSTEILESLFGKFKFMEGSHASAGITSLILAVPALMGEINEHSLEMALSTTSVSQVSGWITENMGQTYLSKRREVFAREDNSHEVMDLDSCDF